MWLYALNSVLCLIVIAIFQERKFCPRGKDGISLTLYEAPTSETRPDHNTRNSACTLLFATRVL